MQSKLDKLLDRSPWGRLLRDMTERFFEHKVGNSAAALTYYLLFAFFPFLIFLSSLLGVLDLPAVPAAELRAFIPQDILELMDSFLTHLQQTSTAPLLIFGLVFAIYFPVRAVVSLMDFLDIAYDTPEKRGLLHRGIIVIILAVGLVLTIAVSLFIMLVGKGLLTWVAQFLPLTVGGIELWNVLRFLLLGCMLLLLMTMLYLVAPGCVVTLRGVLPGAVSSLCCWLVYTMGFSFYVEHMARYSVIYGSIGAIIVLLVWLYATSVTIIMGAELNASLQRNRFFK